MEEGRVVLCLSAAAARGGVVGLPLDAPARAEAGAGGAGRAAGGRGVGEDARGGAPRRRAQTRDAQRLRLADDLARSRRRLVRRQHGAGCEDGGASAAATDRARRARRGPERRCARRAARTHGELPRLRGGRHAHCRRGGRLMGLPAARITDMHTCPMVTGRVPHVGGPIVTGMWTVLTGMMPQARVTDIAVCVGPPDMIVKGAFTVLVGGMPAARIGDMTVHGGVIVTGLPTVLIGDGGAGGGGGGGGGGAGGGGGGGGGGAPSASVSSPQRTDGAAAGDGAGAEPPTPEQNIAAAIDKIKASDFAKTDAGKKVVAKIDDLQKAGKIGFGAGPGTRGDWTGDKIRVGDDYKDNVDAIASELVHEATHAVNEDEYPESKKKLTIDEEMRTNTNQLDFYEEQRKGGFRDPELEDRRDDRSKGKLRDNVRSRYPGAPEHL